MRTAHLNYEWHYPAVDHGGVAVVPLVAPVCPLSSSKFVRSLSSLSVHVIINRFVWTVVVTVYRPVRRGSELQQSAFFNELADLLGRIATRAEPCSLRYLIADLAQRTNRSRWRREHGTAVRSSHRLNIQVSVHRHQLGGLLDVLWHLTAPDVKSMSGCPTTTNCNGPVSSVSRNSRPCTGHRRPPISSVVVRSLSTWSLPSFECRRGGVTLRHRANRHVGSCRPCTHKSFIATFLRFVVWRRVSDRTVRAAYSNCSWLDIRPMASGGSGVYIWKAVWWP